LQSGSKLPRSKLPTKLTHYVLEFDCCWNRLSQLEMRAGEILSPPCQAFKGEIKRGFFLPFDPLPQKARRPPWKKGDKCSPPRGLKPTAKVNRRYAAKRLSRYLIVKGCLYSTPN